MTKSTTLALIILGSIAQTVCAEDWLQWRGPNLNGSTSQTGLPNKLDPEANVLWKVAMPGGSSSTPIVCNGRIFVSSLDDQSKKLLALCFDTKTGKELWRREAGDGFLTTSRINLAGPSPLTDGKTVWFYYGSGDLAAFDMDGKSLWARNIAKEFGAFNFQWLYCASPLLHEGKLYVPVLQRDVPVNGRGSGSTEAPAESYFLAIDPATGKDIFRHVRTNNAKAESKESYATPLPVNFNGRKEIVLIGGDCVTGHDPLTGKELWRYGGWNPQFVTIWRVVPTPIITEDKLIIFTPQPQGKTIAIKLGGSGDITATHKLWENAEVRTDVPSPVLYQNNLYVLDGDFRKGVSCLDISTGKTKWFTPLNSRPVLRSSPTAADGKIYVMNENAEVWVLSAADGKILSNTTLATEGTARACIIPADGKLFARTGNTLYCFDQK